MRLLNHSSLPYERFIKLRGEGKKLIRSARLQKTLKGINVIIRDARGRTHSGKASFDTRRIFINIERDILRKEKKTLFMIGTPHHPVWERYEYSWKDLIFFVLLAQAKKWKYHRLKKSAKCKDISCQFWAARALDAYRRSTRA